MSKFLRPALFILTFLLIWSFFAEPEKRNSTDDVILETDSEISIGKLVMVDVYNNSQKEISFDLDCEKNPLQVEKYVNGEWILKSVEVERKEAEACQDTVVKIAPEESYMLNYGPWNSELFGERAKYRISLPLSVNDQEKVYSTEVEITDRSFFRILWEEVFYKPIFNGLIYLVSIMPGYNLGLAVILLTILIKVILLLPNQKALKAQKQMQKVQPQLDALKKKYQNDPQRLAQETMAIWKKYKVNPTSSCLPLLIQFPILIALFYVVKDGMEFTNPFLLYEGLASFNVESVNPYFLGMDLTKINFIVLPLLVAALQFTQMKLSLPAISKDADPTNPMSMMNKTMLYFMPIMILFFTASVPAAVGLYWGTSTIFGIGQQLVVNRMKD